MAIKEVEEDAAQDPLLCGGDEHRDQCPGEESRGLSGDQSRARSADQHGQDDQGGAASGANDERAERRDRKPKPGRQRQRAKRQAKRKA